MALHEECLLGRQPEQGHGMWPVPLLPHLLCCFLRPQHRWLFTLEPGWPPPGKGQALPGLPGQRILSPSGWASPSQGPKLPGFRWSLCCQLAS